MSKPQVIRYEMVTEMIEEIHESMTNVHTAGAYTVASIIMDSMHEEPFWAGTQTDVTFSEIESIVELWIECDTEEVEQVEAPVVAEEVASKQFSEMTVTELREYAEMVQAEYDAGELDGPIGRQIVRDAKARVEEAEQVAEFEYPTHGIIREMIWTYGPGYWHIETVKQ